VPDVEATRVYRGDDLLRIDTGRHRLLNAERKALQEAPAILTLVLGQDLAGFDERDAANVQADESAGLRGLTRQRVQVGHSTEVARAAQMRCECEPRKSCPKRSM